MQSRSMHELPKAEAELPDGAATAAGTTQAVAPRRAGSVAWSGGRGARGKLVLGRSREQPLSHPLWVRVRT